MSNDSSSKIQPESKLHIKSTSTVVSVYYAHTRDTAQYYAYKEKVTLSLIYAPPPATSLS